MPDSSITLELGSILTISVNELSNGGIIGMEDRKKNDETITKLLKEKEESNKRMLILENIIGTGTAIAFLICVTLSLYVEMPIWALVTLLTISFLVFVGAIIVCLKIEQKVGYYVCDECGHRYVPTFKNVLFAMHINRTRYMKCPKCGKRSWQKKDIIEK